MVQNILQEIIQNKRLEVEYKKKHFPLKDLEYNLDPIPFLTNHTKGNLFLIAEVKKASPSKGIIREDFNPTEIAKIYEESGAGAISVLTDEKYFQGHLDYLKAIRKVVQLPVLRKDFIIDPYQIMEGLIAGASAVLLIVAVLSPSQLKEYIHYSYENKLTPLVEIHDEEELKIALECGANLIGINNRNLKTFATDIHLTKRLVPMIPTGKIIISESGIHSKEDMQYIQSIGADGVLIGEAFMKEKDIAMKVRELLQK